MATVTQQDTSQKQKVRCPTCRAAEVRGLWLARRVLCVHCDICGRDWKIPDRRQAYRLDDALICFLPENAPMAC
jgi:Zn ribbon nucleic-acid-binding protein